MKNQLVKRLKGETPSFFKKLQIICGSIGGIGLALLAIPASTVALPATIITIAGYMVAVGSVGAAVSQLPLKDPKDAK